MQYNLNRVILTCISVLHMKNHQTTTTNKQFHSDGRIFQKAISATASEVASTLAIIAFATMSILACNVAGWSILEPATTKASLLIIGTLSMSVLIARSYMLHEIAKSAAQTITQHHEKQHDKQHMAQESQQDCPESTAAQSQEENQSEQVPTLLQDSCEAALETNQPIATQQM